MEDELEVNHNQIKMLKESFETTGNQDDRARCNLIRRGLVRKQF